MRSKDEPETTPSMTTSRNIALKCQKTSKYSDVIGYIVKCMLKVITALFVSYC